jgi:hypothetical protein
VHQYKALPGDAAGLLRFRPEGVVVDKAGELEDEFVSERDAGEVFDFERDERSDDWTSALCEDLLPFSRAGDVKYACNRVSGPIDPR